MMHWSAPGRRSPAVLICSLLVALVAGGPLPAPAGAAVVDMRVMSFNIRTGSADDGINSWNHPTTGVDRKDLVVQTIKNYDPDILGLQEDLDYQANYIRTNTQVNGANTYGMFRRGANADGSGEMVAILYKTSRFARVREGTFWLSPNPDNEGSEFADAQFPRIVNWLELRDKSNPGFNFVIMNTHWEHGNNDTKEAVRLKSAALMREKMLEIAPNLPMILTGDFNADQGESPYQRLTSRDNFEETPVDEARFLIDTYRNRHPSVSDSDGTPHPFNGDANNRRLDWILHTDTDFDTIAANIDRSSFNGRYPSDHFPVNAILRPILAPEPASAAALGALGGGLLLARRRR